MPEEPPSRTGNGMPVVTTCRVDIHILSGDWGLDDDPPDHIVRRAAEAALALARDGVFETYKGPSELSVTLADDGTLADLNHRYRGKDGPTNVLSFPSFELDELLGCLHMPPDVAQDGPPLMLGDVIVADGVLRAEALAQDKSFHDHLSHLVVHAVLHCLGYDHEDDEDADEMEALEREVLATMGIADPYRAGNLHKAGESL